jgi:hypothetical protein
MPYDTPSRLLGDATMADGFPRSSTPKQSLDVPIDSRAIRRLIEEVRAETFDVPRSYNRTFNRHNR